MFLPAALSPHHRPSTMTHLAPSTTKSSSLQELSSLVRPVPPAVRCMTGALQRVPQAVGDVKEFSTISGAAFFFTIPYIVAIPPLLSTPLGAPFLPSLRILPPLHTRPHTHHVIFLTPLQSSLAPIAPPHPFSTPPLPPLRTSPLFLTCSDHTPLIPAPKSRMVHLIVSMTPSSPPSPSQNQPCDTS